MMKVAQGECVPLCKIKHKISKPVSLSDKLVKLIARKKWSSKNYREHKTTALLLLKRKIKGM